MRFERDIPNLKLAQEVSASRKSRARKYLRNHLSEAQSQGRQKDSLDLSGPQVAFAGQMPGGECAGADNFSRAQGMGGKAAGNSGPELRQT
jgi:hypothetical protein